MYIWALSQRRGVVVHVGTESRRALPVHVGSESSLVHVGMESRRALPVHVGMELRRALYIGVMESRTAFPVHLGTESTCTTAVGQNSATVPDDKHSFSCLITARWRPVAVLVSHG